MAVDYNELLYEKLQAEYNAYIESLKQMTPEQVIENAYQKVFKEDLIIAFESVNLEPLEAKALYLEKYPLDKLYQDWLDSDASYMDMLRDCVSDTAKDLAKELKKKRNEKVGEVDAVYCTGSHYGSKADGLTDLPEKLRTTRACKIFR